MSTRKSPETIFDNKMKQIKNGKRQHIFKERLRSIATNGKGNISERTKKETQKFLNKIGPYSNKSLKRGYKDKAVRFNSKSPQKKSASPEKSASPRTVWLKAGLNQTLKTNTYIMSNILQKTQELAKSRRSTTSTRSRKSGYTKSSPKKIKPSFVRLDIKNNNNLPLSIPLDNLLKLANMVTVKACRYLLIYTKDEKFNKHFSINKERLGDLFTNEQKKIIDKNIKSRKYSRRFWKRFTNKKTWKENKKRSTKKWAKNIRVNNAASNDGFPSAGETLEGMIKDKFYLFNNLSKNFCSYELINKSQAGGGSPLFGFKEIDKINDNLISNKRYGFEFFSFPYKDKVGRRSVIQNNKTTEKLVSECIENQKIILAFTNIYNKKRSGMNHKNLVILDTRRNLIVHFEPQYSKERFGLAQTFNRKERLNEDDIKYQFKDYFLKNKDIDNYSYVKLHGNQPSVGKGSVWCVVFCMYFGLLYLKNSEYI